MRALAGFIARLAARAGRRPVDARGYSELHSSLIVDTSFPLVARLLAPTEHLRRPLGDVGG